MRYLLTMLMLCGIAHAQTYHIRYDTVKIGKGTGGPGELVLESSTKDTTNGVLINYGSGRTSFQRIRAISATQFTVGTDTITITGSGGGGSYTAGWGIDITGTTISADTSAGFLATQWYVDNAGGGGGGDTANLVIQNVGVGQQTWYASGDTLYEKRLKNGYGYWWTTDTDSSVLLNKDSFLFSTRAYAVKVADSLGGGGGGGNVIDNPAWEIYKGLGSNIIAETYGRDRTYITQVTNLTDGQIRFAAIYVPVAGTITGVKIYQGVQGNFTGDNTNAIALYSYSAGTLTKVAETANDENIFKNAANTYNDISFSTPYSAAVGTYFIGYLYNSSAQTTAPAMGGFATLQNVGIGTSDLTNSAKLVSLLSGQTTLPATQAMSGLTATTLPLYGGVY